MAVWASTISDDSLEDILSREEPSLDTIDEPTEYYDQKERDEELEEVENRGEIAQEIYQFFDKDMGNQIPDTDEDDLQEKHSICKSSHCEDDSVRTIIFLESAIESIEKTEDKTDEEKAQEIDLQCPPAIRSVIGHSYGFHLCFESSNRLGVLLT